MKPSRPTVAHALLLVLATSCAETQTPPPPPPPPPPVALPAPAARAPAAEPPPLRPEAAHNLAMLAAACWFGGIWGDAEGDSAEMRVEASQARCHDVVRRVYGSDEKDRYEQLRALEPSVVGDIAAKVETLAKDDPDDAPRSKTLAALVQAVAGAQREAMFARRAALRVRRDLEREPENLSADEVSGVPQLKDTRMLEALLKTEAGDITHDAHALGVLAALERMQTGIDLPKHMKIYAVAGANKILFGVEPPVVPDDASRRLKPGTWLAYITDVAKAAGHAVPDSVKVAKRREPLAWGGTLEGYADKLRGDLDGLARDTRLHHVVSVVINRLDAEYKAELNAMTGPPSQKDTKALGPKAPPKR